MKKLNDILSVMGHLAKKENSQLNPNSGHGRGEGRGGGK
jgi:hypothetical protein